MIRMRANLSTHDSSRGFNAYLKNGVLATYITLIVFVRELLNKQISKIFLVLICILETATNEPNNNNSRMRM